MELQKISAVMVVRNEENIIENCLKSISDAVDEIIIIDGMSTDHTVDIAKKFTDKIFIRPPHGYGDPDRAYGVDLASNNWILFLDADEVVTNELKAEITQVLASPRFSSYLIPRMNFMMGILLKSTYPDYQLRLFEKGHVVISDKIHNFINGKSESGKLVNPILHYTIRSLDQMVHRRENYTLIEAQQLQINFTRSDYIRYFIVKPLSEFFKRFLLRKGMFGTTADWLFSFETLIYNIEIAEKAWLLKKRREKM